MIKLDKELKKEDVSETEKEIRVQKSKKVLSSALAELVVDSKEDKKILFDGELVKKKVVDVVQI